jgi:TPP-dependent pyruvate/acetoin dehydrogenase alpha subunit
MATKVASVYNTTTPGGVTRMHEIAMPSVSMAVTEGTILRWLKEPGDHVIAGDAVAEIETEKANVEVTSQIDGWLGPHLFLVGMVVPAGNTIVQILTEDEVGRLNVAPADHQLGELPAEVDSEPVDSAGLHFDVGSMQSPTTTTALETTDSEIAADEIRPLYDWSAPAPLDEGAGPVEAVGTPTPPETTSAVIDIGPNNSTGPSSPDPTVFDHEESDDDDTWEEVAVHDSVKPRLVTPHDILSRVGAGHTNVVSGVSPLTRAGEADSWSSPVEGSRWQIDTSESERLVFENGSYDTARERTNEELRAWLETMLLIQVTDREVRARIANRTLPPTVRTAGRWGGVAVGAVSALEPDDAVIAALRGYHYALARGVPLDALLAYLFGDARGCLGGHAGATRFAAPAAHVYGANGIPGGGFNLALGLTLAYRLRSSTRLALAFLEERDAEAGRSWEAARIAARWELPIVLVLEAGPRLVNVDFGLPVLEVDGSNVEAVFAATASAVQAAREGLGPTLVRAVIDPSLATGDDSVQRLAQTLEELGWLQTAELAELQSKAHDQVEDALLAVTTALPLRRNA